MNSCIHVWLVKAATNCVQALKEARATIAWWQDRQAKLSQRLSQKRSKLVSSALRKLPLKATQARR